MTTTSDAATDATAAAAGDGREWKYICRGCQTAVRKRNGKPVTVGVDKVRDGIATRATAETLASIHETLNNGHHVEVMPDE